MFASLTQSFRVPGPFVKKNSPLSKKFIRSKIKLCYRNWGPGAYVNSTLLAAARTSLIVTAFAIQLYFNILHKTPSHLVSLMRILNLYFDERRDVLYLY